jgi:hypothetical protein
MEILVDGRPLAELPYGASTYVEERWPGVSTPSG